MTPTLSDMPVEIFHNIIDYLPESGDTDFEQILHRDLKTLRGTCRDIEAKTRRPFGQEFCRTIAINVTVKSSKFNDAILTHDFFRSYVRKIDVSISFTAGSQDEAVEWNSYSLREGGKAFRHAFEMVLARVENVTGLTIRSPDEFEAIKTECETSIQRGWHDVIEAALQIILAQNTIHLQDLEIGIESLLSLPLPMHVIHALPKNPSAFSDLDMLALLHVDRRQIGKYSPISNTRTAMEDITKLASLAPNINCLRYTAQGSRFVYDIIDYEIKEPPTNISPLLPLTQLDLAHIAMDEVHFKHVLLFFSTTLTLLFLDDINLISGTWKAMFSLFRHKLQLELVNMSRLLIDYSKKVDFLAIAKHRPFIIDENIVQNRDLEWFAATDDVTEASAAYEERAKDLDALTADGWIWICHNRADGDWFEVAKEEGDDVNMWLALVEDQHTLR